MASYRIPNFHDRSARRGWRPIRGTVSLRGRPCNDMFRFPLVASEAESGMVVLSRALLLHSVVVYARERTWTGLGSRSVMPSRCRYNKSSIPFALRLKLPRLKLAVCCWSQWFHSDALALFDFPSDVDESHNAVTADIGSVDRPKNCFNVPASKQCKWLSNLSTSVKAAAPAVLVSSASSSDRASEYVVEKWCG